MPPCCLPSVSEVCGFMNLKIGSIVLGGFQATYAFLKFAIYEYYAVHKQLAPAGGWTILAHAIVHIFHFMEFSAGVLAVAGAMFFIKTNLSVAVCLCKFLPFVLLPTYAELTYAALVGTAAYEAILAPALYFVTTPYLIYNAIVWSSFAVEEEIFTRRLLFFTERQYPTRAEVGPEGAPDKYNF